MWVSVYTAEGEFRLRLNTRGIEPQSEGHPVLPFRRQERTPRDGLVQVSGHVVFCRDIVRGEGLVVRSCDACITLSAQELAHGPREKLTPRQTQTLRHASGPLEHVIGD